MEYNKGYIQLKLLTFPVLYFIAIAGLFVYSFTQIDLNLTLFSNPWYQAVQKYLIDIGYFQRSISSGIFLILVSCLIISYLAILYIIFDKKMGLKAVYFLIATVIFFCFISYPAFSHDIFNYIFDARIITKYGQNPYLFKALDFPADQWTRFMHWTHRTYPYGPLWLGLTVPFSFFSFGKFVPTLLGFRLLFILSYLLNIFLVKKITGYYGNRNYLFHTAAFALNPLIVIETLLSPHNEALMLSFLLLSIYFILVKRKLFISFVVLAFSAGIKFITAPLAVPIIFFSKLSGKDHDGDRLIVACIAVLVIPIAYLVYIREFYPWYFVTVAGLGMLLKRSSNLQKIIIALSSVLPLRYFEIINKGDYNLVNPYFQELIYFIPALLIFLFSFVSEKHFLIKNKQ